MRTLFRHKGIFTVEQYRKGRLLKTVKAFNDITTEGKNHLLDVVFGAAAPVTQVDPWYIGLIDNAGFAALLDADTLPSHTGWTEYTNYTGNRQAWSDADASGGSKANSSTSDFTISGATGTETVYGIFLAAVATGTAGVLMTTAAFDATIDVVNSDILKVAYTIGY